LIPISAVTGMGLDSLVRRLGDLVEKAREERGYEASEERTLYLFDPSREKGFRVRREGEGFRVEGEAVESMVRRLDLSKPQALAYVQSRLKRMGVEEELLKQGAAEGDTVIIGDYVFDFLPEG